MQGTTSRIKLAGGRACVRARATASTAGWSRLWSDWPVHSKHATKIKPQHRGTHAALSEGFAYKVVGAHGIRCPGNLYRANLMNTDYFHYGHRPETLCNSVNLLTPTIWKYSAKQYISDVRTHQNSRCKFLSFQTNNHRSRARARTTHLLSSFFAVSRSMSWCWRRSACGRTWSAFMCV